ncbi:MAG: 2-oxo acid dehydrogenase subunit E2 [Gammaproteobacteria bacterium]|nr:2-oxo acid dehydrogenase subunit E2 [Gammaproteobacteria bacterium]
MMPSPEHETDIVIPDIGEAEDVEVIELCVAPGDTVEVDDPLIVIESDKASMEVPSPFAGTLRDLKVVLGDEVNAGDVIATIAADAPTPAADAAEPVEERAFSRGARGGDPSQESAGQTEEVEVTPTPAAESPARPVTVADVAVPHTPTGTGRVYAGPAVRRLARELGADLEAIRGSGPRGRIVKDDVKAFVKATMTAPAPAASLPAVPVIDFARFGPVEEVPLTRLQARGGTNLYGSWLNVVHVTQHDEADVTELEAFRKSLAREGEERGVKLTPLAFVMKACAENLRAFPRLNASLNASADGLILKQYHHVGFAVDTEEGLVVPVIRDVDQKGVWQLAAEIAELSASARERRLKPDDLQGGCFTVSSLGRIGGTGFTPIVNAPEVGILGVGRLATKPVWDGLEFRPRAVLPLALSYDHRAINGVEGGSFMVELTRLLGDIRRLVM